MTKPSLDPRPRQLSAAELAERHSKWYYAQRRRAESEPNSTAWTPPPALLRLWFSRGLTYKAMAALCGRHPRVLMSACTRLGLYRASEAVVAERARNAAKGRVAKANPKELSKP